MKTLFQKVAVFDLDGTLLDTLQDLTNSVNFAVAQFGISPYTPAQVSQMIGCGVSVLMSRALGESCQIHHQSAVELQRRFYLQNAAQNTLPYNGVETMLDCLKSRGVALAVHTNKDENIARLLVRRFLPQIDFVRGKTPQSLRKPDATRLLKLLNELGNPKAVYIGDSDTDIQTAKNAHLPCISVTWGFRTKEFLSTCGAQHLAENTSQVLRLFDELAGV